MNHSRLPRQMIEATLLMLFLAGCRAPTSVSQAPAVTSTPIQPTSVSMASVPTSAPPTPTQEPAREGLIVFYSERDGNAEIYVMNPDGSNQRRLTENNSDEFTPAWSPDGTQIAFESDRDDPNPVRCFPNCVWKIYIMNADGSNPRKLIDLPTGEGHADWSPDGNKFSFEADRDGDDKADIYIANADGSDPQQLTYDAADDRAADWSPDGEQIAFMSDRDGRNDIYLMNVDGSDVRKLVDTGLDDYFPDWSPDGKQIVFFAANWPTIRQDIYIVNADGSDLRKLTDTPRVVDESPQWSPDGSKIVFQTDRDGNFEIYMMDPDGSNQQNVTRNPGRDYWPDWWMPRSAPPITGASNWHIAFVSTRDGSGEICLAAIASSFAGLAAYRGTDDCVNSHQEKWFAVYYLDRTGITQRLTPCLAHCWPLNSTSRAPAQERCRACT